MTAELITEPIVEFVRGKGIRTDLEHSLQEE
jgi:hypothetical protein